MKVGEFNVYISGKSIAVIDKVGNPEIKKSIRISLEENIGNLIRELSDCNIDEIILTSKLEPQKIHKYKLSLKGRVMRLFGCFAPVKSRSLSGNIVNLNDRIYKLKEMK